MKRLVFFAVVLIVAVLMGVQIKTNPGYVLINTHHVAIETRLWFAIVSLLVSFIVLYFIIRFLKLAFSAPKHWHSWRQHEKQDKAINNAYKGFLALINGQWSKAQKLLQHNPKRVPLPLINYLATAVAAQRAGELSERDKYLRRAKQSAPQEKLAINLVQAQLQYEAGDYAQTLQTLLQINTQAQHQPQVLAQLVKVQKKLKNWPALAELIEPVKRHRALPESQIKLLALLTYEQLFSIVSDPIELKNYWQAMDKQYRALPALIFSFSTALTRLNEVEWAEKLVRSTLKQHWQPTLARLYGAIKTDICKKQLAQAEQWLQAHPKDANLLYTCARLAERLQLWGKSKDYYQLSLSITMDPEVCAAYARLLEQQGDIKQSLVYYRQAVNPPQ